MRGNWLLTGGIGGILFASFLLGCGLDDFVRVEPAEPAEPPALECPELADCSGYECGLDPVCGTSCGECSDAELCWEPPDEPELGTECCAPASCEDLGAECGVHDDGCGGTVTCGTCGANSDCVASGEGFVCGCRVVGDGGLYTVDVESIRAVISVTLDGQVAPGTASTETQHAAFLFKPRRGSLGVGWSAMHRGTWDFAAGAPRSEVPFRLVPGEYDLYYKRVGTDSESPWPLNRLSLLQSGLVVEAGMEPIAIDLSPIVCPLDLSLDGVPVEDVPLLEDQVVILELGSPGSSGRPDDEFGPESASPDVVPLASFGLEEDEIVLPGEVRVLPGSYWLTYTNTLNLSSDLSTTPSDWPIGVGARTVPLSLLPQSPEIVVDIPYSEVQFELSLAGEAVTVDLLQEGDAPRLALAVPMMGPGDGPGGNGGGGPGGPGGMSSFSELHLPPLVHEDSGLPNLPLAVRVIEEDFDLLYWHDWDPREDEGEGSVRWPWNRGVVVQDLDLSDGSVVSADVDAVEVQLHLLLQGEELSPVNTGEGDLGWLSIVSSAAMGPGGAWDLPPVYDGEVHGLLPLRILPDSYSFMYDSDGLQGMAHWPAAGDSLGLTQEVDLAVDQSLTIDVPVIDVTVEASLHGGPLPGADDEDAPWLQFSWQYAGGGGGPESQGWIPAAAFSLPLGGEPQSVRTLPGPYQVIYRPGAQGSEAAWPHATYKVVPSTTLMSSMELAVDLEYRTIAVEFTLDGAQAGVENSSEGDHGRIWLTRPSPRSTYGWVGCWDELQGAGASQVLNLPPGEYFVQYYPAIGQGPDEPESNPTDSTWPLSPGFEVGCLAIQ